MVLVESVRFTRGQRREKALARLAAFALLLPLFFIDLGKHHSPLFVEMMDGAHSVVFFFVGLLLYPLFRMKLVGKFFAVLGFVAIASFGIEGLQEVVGRSFQWGDIYRNMLGAGLGAMMATISIARHKYVRKQAGLTFAFLFALVLLDRAALFSHLASQTYMASNKPVLADFRYDFEMVNWGSRNSSISRKQDALIIRPNEDDKTAVATFKNFPKDWSDFDKVVLELDNPNNEVLKFRIDLMDERIRGDWKNKNARSSLNLALKPGLNTVEVPLNNLLSNAKIQSIDLERMSRIHLYVPKSKQSHLLKLNSIVLEPELFANN